MGAPVHLWHLLGYQATHFRFNRSAFNLGEKRNGVMSRPVTSWPKSSEEGTRWERGRGNRDTAAEPPLNTLVSSTQSRTFQRFLLLSRPRRRRRFLLASHSSTPLSQSLQCRPLYNTSPAMPASSHPPHCTAVLCSPTTPHNHSARPHLIPALSFSFLISFHPAFSLGVPGGGSETGS